MNSTPAEWVIVGGGRVGQTLGLLCTELGRGGVRAVWNCTDAGSARARKHIDAPHFLSGDLLEIGEHLQEPAVVWLTVKDDVLAEVATALAPIIAAGSLVLHTSGSQSSRLLSESGITAPVASVHPLLAITDPVRALDRLSHVTWAVEGDPPAVEFATALLAEIGVCPINIDPGAKVLYHAAAVLSANLLVGLMDVAIATAMQAGITEPDARAMLVALAESSVENLRTQTPAQALSGPVARGDEQTVAAHLEALEELPDPQIAKLYELLTERARGLMARKST